MKKLIATYWTTLDGYIAGPNGEMDWIRGDEELSAYEIGMVSDADTLLLGKKTYQDFAQYWGSVPANPNAPQWEKIYADKVNALDHFVISRTLQKAEWGKSTLWRDLDATKVEALKAAPGSSILMYGSATILQQLTNLGLLDEYHLLIHPLLLGGGRLLLDNIDQRVQLELADVHRFKSGVLRLVYRKA
jgi:dihydrofolate reductase